MKPKRKQHPKRSKPASAQVISLAAYRASHRPPAPAQEERPPLFNLYCAWLSLGAAWTFWW